MNDLDKIRVFYHVMKEGSLQRASKILEIEPSTISKHLKDLETHIGEKLYLRKRRGLVTTPRGEEIFTVAQQTVPNLEETLKSTKEKRKTPHRITIMTTTGVIGIWIMEHVKELTKIYPDLKIKIITVPGEVDFLSSKADFGILPKISNGQGLYQKKILTFHFKLYASKDYIKDFGMPKDLEDLQNHKLLSFYSDEIGHLGNIDWHLKRGMPEKDIRDSWLQVNSALLLFEAVRQGMGIMSFPEEFKYLDNPNFVQVLPDCDLKNNAYFVRRATEFPSELMRTCEQLFS